MRKTIFSLAFMALVLGAQKNGVADTTQQPPQCWRENSPRVIDGNFRLVVHASKLSALEVVEALDQVGQAAWKAGASAPRFPQIYGGNTLFINVQAAQNAEESREQMMDRVQTALGKLLSVKGVSIQCEQPGHN